MRLCKTNRLLLCTFFLLISALLTISTSFAKYVTNSHISASAIAAEFNVEIIAPDELQFVSAEAPYKHVFSTEDEIKQLEFSIANNGEVSVWCMVSIGGDIQYRIIVDDAVRDNFTLKTGEHIDFMVEILSTGLSSNITDATLILDVQQAEGT